MTRGMTESDKYFSPLPYERLMDVCSKIRHVALDMDGTIYIGSRLFPYTKKFLSDLRENGIGYSFLTNNPSRSTDDYMRKLSGMGIDVSREEINTSAGLTIYYIKRRFPGARRLFILGTPSMIAEFEAAGFESVPDSPSRRPDLLVVAFDMTLSYDRLCRAAWWAEKGVPYIATNPDRVCPTDRPVVLVDCGSICSAIECATGRKPDVVMGKPNPGMLHLIAERHSLRPEEIAMCGDRLYTDVETARNAGALGVLVLSGETTLVTALAAEPKPPVTVENVGVFGELLLQARTSVN